MRINSTPPRTVIAWSEDISRLHAPESFLRIALTACDLNRKVPRLVTLLCDMARFFVAAKTLLIAARNSRPAKGDREMRRCRLVAGERLGGGRRQRGSGEASNNDQEGENAHNEFHS